MLALNSESYIWWALKSSYPVVDYFAVVEGAILYDEYHNKFHSVPATSEGLSLDNTSREIQRFIKEDDSQHKVHYQKVGYVYSWEDLRNAAHLMLPHDTDIELIQDADCLFKPEDIKKATTVLEQYPEVYEVANYCWTFIWDFKHVMRCKKKWKEFWRWCFFRYNPSMRFFRERTIQFDDGSSAERIKIDWKDFLKLTPEKDKNYVVYDPNLLNVYHFGNVQEKERMEVQLMRKFFAPQTMQKNRLVLPNRKREILLAWLKMYHKYYTKVPDDSEEYFERFMGTYPLDGLIQKHPYFDKEEAWFRHNDLESDPKSSFYGKEWWGNV